MVSKTEDIVKKSLKKEYEKQLKNIESQYQRSTERLGVVYEDTKTLVEELDLNDATLFDFFMKTDGNVRVTKVEDDKGLKLITYYGKTLFGDNPIQLEKDTKYKVILMAVKEED